MDENAAALDLASEAWRRFASGDLGGALAFAQRAVEGAAPPGAEAALGFFLIQADRLDEAAATLLPARERCPDHASLHWYTGYLLQRRGDKAGAAAAFRQAFELDGSLDEAAFALAWALHDLGRIGEAAAWGAKALASRRTAPRLLQMGWLHKSMGAYAQAVQVYREAIQALDAGAPEQALLHLHLAQCLDDVGQRSEADVLLRHAFERWPQDAELLSGAAWHCRDRGDTAGAFRLARALVHAHPQRATSWHLLGVLQQDSGDLRDADASLQRSQKLDLGLTDALLRRAQIQREWKLFEGARWLLDLALQRAPDDDAAQDLLAQVLLDQQEIEAARRLLLRRLRRNPRSADLWRLFAVAQSSRGRPLIAARSLRRALAQEPENIEALRMQGWLALERGDPDTAALAARALLKCVPDDSAAHIQAAFVMAHAGLMQEAQRWAERAVAHAPGVGEAWRALSFVRLHQRHLAEAEAAVQQALRLAPGNADSLRHLGWVLMAQGRHGQAELAFLRVLQDKPGDSGPRVELVQARMRGGRFDAGLDEVRGLLRERPGWPPALALQAQLMAEARLPGAAEACAQLLRASRSSPDAVRTLLRLVGLGGSEGSQARRLLALVPADALRGAWRDAITLAVHTQGYECLARLAQAACEDLADDPWTAAAALYAASLSPDTQAANLARQARDWYRGLKVRSGLAQLPLAPQSWVADHRPRVAYVASQLHYSLLARVLAAHAPERAEIFLYTNHPCPGLPPHVHLHPLEPEALAESCAANRIDVAIDAGGLHPMEGQFELLRAYARRIAPVQIGWLGCWGSAGGVFDALLADQASVPPEQEPLYEEEVLRLQGGQWCWDPPLSAPATGAPPLFANGSPTFGVTARSLRLGAACLDVFARVVAAVPRSSIRFIGEVAKDWPLRREILHRMQLQGVDTGRVLFDPVVPHADYLQWFARVDVVLDSFPGNGGLSTLDPLWMGVPVVTLAGAWSGARQGASLLVGIGLPQWVAKDAAQFLSVAVALAGDCAALSAHRSGLRARIMGSPLVDGRRVAAQVEDMCLRLKEGSARQVQARDGKARTRAHAQHTLDIWLAVPRTIDLPCVEAGTVPELSVIVVLFNQAGLSRRTLQALADQQGATFETIIVDNASSDRTSELLDRVRGARVIRNADNVGFLLAARQGAAAASGLRLAFLNSDAILQEGALQATLAAMRADPAIGALGARVVLTDGGLQEAGNMVFADGSTGGIGRGEDAFGHAARAARASDYVSGVFLVTPASVWRMLGGFDEAYAPAYYEDTDYCLRVWQAGFRVVYEPSVLLEHLEWGSATGDSATVLMRRNRAVFCARHATWLQGQPLPQPLPLDGDRWRSPEDLPRLPRVLYLENEVPHMARGGGLPRARLMLQALQGWPVTLFPLWTPHDDWRAIQVSLPQSVEVALDHGLGGLEAFLARRRGVYDVLMISRPPNLQALAPLRARRPELFAGMRLVYDAEALFALREIAMAGVLGRPLGHPAGQARIDAEMALAAGAGDVLVVSQRDARYFAAAGLRTHVLSHSIAPRRDAPGPTGRSGLLFVGALHSGTPNEDGLLWFIREVMPLLRQRLPVAPVLSVVGVCLSDQVAASAAPDVRLLGPQHVLEPHYDAARVFVAPVRFAGGVPAKVIEAAANGIPTVASALLVRQLQWREGLDILGARDAPAFASAIARLLQEDAAWLCQQHAAWEQCAQRYAPELFGHTLRRVLVQAGAAA